MIQRRKGTCQNTQFFRQPPPPICWEIVLISQHSIKGSLFYIQTAQLLVYKNQCVRKQKFVSFNTSMKIMRRDSLSLILFNMTMEKVMPSLCHFHNGMNSSRLSQYLLMNCLLQESENTMQAPGKGEGKYDLRSRVQLLVC